MSLSCLCGHKYPPSFAALRRPSPPVHPLAPRDHTHCVAIRGPPLPPPLPSLYPILSSSSNPTSHLHTSTPPTPPAPPTPPTPPHLHSLSAKTLEDNLECFARASNTDGVASIEYNLACPNIIGKPIIAYDFDQLTVVLEALAEHEDIGKKPLGVKLPPYFDGPHFGRAADIINR